MPGKLVHTSEILVLLGDNWFVERSAKQATEIIGRIIKCTDIFPDLYGFILKLLLKIEHTVQTTWILYLLLNNMLPSC